MGLVHTPDRGLSTPTVRRFPSKFAISRFPRREKGTYSPLFFFGGGKPAGIRTPALMLPRDFYVMVQSIVPQRGSVYSTLLLPYCYKTQVLV